MGGGEKELDSGDCHDLLSTEVWDGLSSPSPEVAGRGFLGKAQGPLQTGAAFLPVRSPDTQSACSVGHRGLSGTQPALKDPTEMSPVQPATISLIPLTSFGRALREGPQVTLVLLEEETPQSSLARSVPPEGTEKAATCQPGRTLGQNLPC